MKTNPSDSVSLVNKEQLLKDYQVALIKTLTLVKHVWVTTDLSSNDDKTYEEAIKLGDDVLMKHAQLKRMD